MFHKKGVALTGALSNFRILAMKSRRCSYAGASSNPMIASSDLQTIQTPAIADCTPKESIYRILSTHMNKGHFTLTQVFRQNNVAIYRKTKVGYLGFETIVIRNREQYEIAGKVVPAAEVYPNNEAWGTLGFTYSNLEAAMRRAVSLLQER
jgi:hypothetical protein